MSGLSELFLGTIALSTLVMAVIQVGVIVVLLRTVRQAQQIVASVQREIAPLAAKASAIADEASRTASLAAAQAEKVDRLVDDLSRRVDETSAIVQQAIVTPAREGMALVSALKAGLAALRGAADLRPRHGRHAEDEDPLFIG